MKEAINRLFNRGPERTYQVTTWLGSREEWGGDRRRFVGLLTQAEIDKARQSFSDNREEDNCWGDRAFSMFPERFNPR